MRTESRDGVEIMKYKSRRRNRPTKVPPTELRVLAIPHIPFESGQLEDPSICADIRDVSTDYVQG